MERFSYALEFYNNKFYDLNNVNLFKRKVNEAERIEEIKKLQKEATYLEYHEDNKYKEIDSIIKEKTKELNNNSKYQEYLSKLKKFNNTLLASSLLLEDYIDSKVSI